MIQRIFLFIYFMSFSCGLFAQNTKLDNSPIGKLKRDVEFLTSPNLEGRLTGTEGANAAAEYLETRFKQLGIEPYKGKYKWEFTAKTGLVLGKNAYFKIFDKKLNLGKDFVFLPYGQGNIIKGMCLPSVNEEDNVWLVSAKQIRLLESNNAQKTLFEASRDCISKGASAVVIFNDIDATQDLTSLNLNTFEKLDKPVAFINHHIFQSEIKPNLRKNWIDVDARLGFEDASSTGKNVVAMINNSAAINVLVTSNYDFVGSQGEFLAGADYNASGIAALLQTAEMVKLNGLKKYNYIFIAFSGREQDLQGSKSFIAQNEGMLTSYSCVINLDKLGRFNATAKELFVSGIGTSADWIGITQRANKTSLKFKVDSSGSNVKSDQLPFYNNNIPVLHVSTGFHDDYLTANDISGKINWNGLLGCVSYVYNLIAEIDKSSKLNFQKTNDIGPKIAKAKQNLFLTLDYTFDQNGVRVNTCEANKIAAKAGMKHGDIILKIGPFKIIDVDDYVEAMNKTDKEVETTIIVKRDKNEYKFFVTFQ